MKKTLVACILAMGLCCSFGACDLFDSASMGDVSSSDVTSSTVTSNEESQSSVEEEIVTCTITFKQNGAENIVKTVTKGETLTDIPTPNAKTGYTVVWDVTSFTSVAEDMEVNAVETPNTYTVTYDANGGIVATETQEVTYDAETTLAVPEREDYGFMGWIYEGNVIVSGEAWTIANDVTLVASWEDRRPEFTVTFVDGTETTTVTVKKGESVAEADIPTPTEKTGYTVDMENWYADEACTEVASFENVQGNVTVYAKATAKTYEITLDADGGTLANTTIVVTYGEAFELPTPMLPGWKFEGWTYNGEKVEGTWNIDADDVELVAVWTREWSGNY